MARTKQTARQSTGGKAPRKQLATSASRDLRAFMTSQQQVGAAVRADDMAPQSTSYLNHENVTGSFDFKIDKTSHDFQPQLAVATVAHPQTGIPEQWLSVQFASKFDGDGFNEHGRPAVSLVVVLDISGSMGCALELHEAGSTPFGSMLQSGQSKLDAAKRCLLAILAQLGENDSIGVLLFNHETHTLHGPARATNATKAAITKKLDGVRPGGGTRLEKGFVDGMAALSGASGDQSLRRLYFLTDMRSSVLDETGVLQHAKERAASAGLHTTVVGMGVDLSVGTVEALSSIRGGKYCSVATVGEFERSVGSDFCHDVVPMAYGIQLTLGGGWAIERACGSAELNSLPSGAAQIEVSSEFSSPHNVDGTVCGGVIMLKLRSPAEQAGSPPRRATRRSLNSSLNSSLPVSASWTTRAGDTAGNSSVVSVATAVGPTSQIGAASLRKALALVRFVDLQKSFCDAGDHQSESDLEGRLARLAGYKAGRDGMMSEMAALGDTSILEGGANHSFLQTLEQIISFEAQETDALEKRAAKEEERKAAEERRQQRPKRKRSGAAAPAAVPKELVCPITQTLMVDPVSTCDGHTFERTAIERWLQTSNRSPLTGLPLGSKALTPSHALRALAEAHAA